MQRAGAEVGDSPARGTAAIYVRLSQDRSGAGVGVTTQEVDCLPLAERRGYPLERIRVYSDNDLSAYSGKPRPAYRRLLRDIESGEITFLAAWHNDRLHRSIKELAEFVDLVRETGIEVETARAGDIDLSTPTGRMIAFNLGNIAEYESAHKSERHLAAEVRIAKAGKAHGGRRPFGFEADRVTIRQDEAELIREAARRVLRGESVFGICNDWARRDVRTPISISPKTSKQTGGLRWGVTGLRKVLLSGRAAGVREHQGRVVGNAEWPAIITAEESARLGDALRRPNLRGKGTGNRPSKYILSGLAYCAVCGARLIARGADGRRSMQCSPDPRDDPRDGPARLHRGHVRVVAEPMESLVIETVMQAIEQGQLSRILEAEQGDHASNLGAELATVEAKLASLAAMWAAGDIAEGEWKAAREPLSNRRRDLLARLDVIRQRDDRATIPEPLREKWPELTFDQRRAILATVIDKVIVRQTRHGVPRFDRERVGIIWRV